MAILTVSIGGGVAFMKEEPINNKNHDFDTAGTNSDVLTGKIFTAEELEKNGIDFLMYTGLFYIYKKDNKRFLMNKLENGSMKVFQEYFV